MSSDTPGDERPDPATNPTVLIRIEDLERMRAIDAERISVLEAEVRALRREVRA